MIPITLKLQQIFILIVLNSLSFLSMSPVGKLTQN